MSEDFVFGLIQSEDQFPIDFDAAWQWIGYTRKDSAKDALLKAEFIKGIDFQVFRSIPENLRGGRPSEKIVLTVDCLKSFAMMAGTAKGRQVRKYFLQCEAELKRRIRLDSIRQRRLTPDEICDLCVLPTPKPWGPHFGEQYYQHLSRITGLKSQGNKRPALWGQLTKEFVYDYLPKGVYESIKRCKEETGSWDKLHQFLSEEGEQIFWKHMGAVLAIMSCAPSVKELRKNLNASQTGQIQTLIW